MGFGYRYFLFEQDGTIKHIPHRVVEGFHRRENRLPEYAGQTVRIVFVGIVVRDRRPIRTQYVIGHIWKFDYLGRFDEEFEDAQSRDMAESLASDLGLDLDPGGDGTVVPFPTQIAWGRMNKMFQWEPTPADITRIVHAIWPETADRPTKRPKIARGVRMKGPCARS
jgi:hypothetical protein